jgi:hypothetical protein
LSAQAGADVPQRHLHAKLPVLRRAGGLGGLQTAAEQPTALRPTRGIGVVARFWLPALTERIGETNP